jgi:SlyX protein
MIEERLEKIEIKISFQEDLLDELNKTIYEQQKKLQQLEAVCISLVRQIQSLAEASNENKTLNERPPHY